LTLQGLCNKFNSSGGEAWKVQKRDLSTGALCVEERYRRIGIGARAGGIAVSAGRNIYCWREYNGVFRMKKCAASSAIRSKKNNEVSCHSLGLLLSIAAAFSQPIRGPGATDNDWHKACNWSLNLIPTCAHDVVIPNTSNKPKRLPRDRFANVACASRWRLL